MEDGADEVLAKVERFSTSLLFYKLMGENLCLFCYWTQRACDSNEYNL